jgi:hypothetical protein
MNETVKMKKSEGSMHTISFGTSPRPTELLRLTDIEEGEVGRCANSFTKNSGFYLAGVLAGTALTVVFVIFILGLIFT